MVRSREDGFDECLLKYSSCASLAASGACSFKFELQGFAWGNSRSFIATVAGMCVGR